MDPTSVGWRGERSIFYKGVETSLSHTHFENLEGKSERESLKRTISTSGGLRRLQIESFDELDRHVRELSTLINTKTCEIDKGRGGGGL